MHDDVEPPKQRRELTPERVNGDPQPVRRCMRAIAGPQHLEQQIARSRSTAPGCEVFQHRDWLTTTGAVDSYTVCLSFETSQAIEGQLSGRMSVTGRVRL